MQSIIIRYLELFCITSFFNHFHCDQYTPTNYTDNILQYQINGCAANCSRQFKNKVSLIHSIKIVFRFNKFVRQKIVTVTF